MTGILHLFDELLEETRELMEDVTAAGSSASQATRSNVLKVYSDASIRRAQLDADLRDADADLNEHVKRHSLPQWFTTEGLLDRLQREEMAEKMDDA